MELNAYRIILTAVFMCALAFPACAVGGDMGWYNIHCNVDGASVYFDGNYMGEISGNVLSVGVYTTATPYSKVSVQKSGYYTASTSLPGTPAAGESADVYVTLNKMATATPTESGTGGLYISTSPSGASIFLNNVYQGLSPLTISGLKSGTTYSVEAEKDGYDSSSQNVYISGGYTQSVYLSLETPGSISVTSNPSGAYVAMNGNIVGKTPYVITGLSSGDHEIEVSKNGYYNYKKTVNVVQGTQISVYAVLDPILANNEILVKSNPSGAKIYLDGVYVGETMDKVYYPVENVADGSHKITLTLEGYSDYTTSVVMSGTSVKVYAEMSAGSSSGTGLLSVSSNPSGAMIYLDDGYQGVTTPYTLSGISPGEHTVMLRLSGYQDTYSKITVYAGQTSTLKMGLSSSSQATTTKTGEQTPVQTQSSPLPLTVATAGVFGGIALYMMKKKE
ncbi:hypothetical protein J2128_002441 [Methanomicrobium sp. W14]|uniref:PEGA domain-containing protein n=1 Tax=Methanomicrobium sp. W14 TaxID=2817839 RepID=UPI001AE78E94|nr:PEGA domain-containing protein [Methanomicrobium sp. W14]MBP2134475.1 hypothetical protein [Methanomicrobium sp. W14]